MRQRSQLEQLCFILMLTVTINCKHAGVWLTPPPPPPPVDSPLLSMIVIKHCPEHEEARTGLHSGCTDSDAVLRTALSEDQGHWPTARIVQNSKTAFGKHSHHITEEKVKQTSHWKIPFLWLPLTCWWYISEITDLPVAAPPQQQLPSRFHHPQYHLQ